jgi:hypothetical protein
MSEKNMKKDTDRDVKPTRGQESNENWDDQNNDQENPQKAEQPKMNVNRTDEEENTEKGENKTGPGLG